MITILPFVRMTAAIAVCYGVCVAVLVAVMWDFGDAATLGSSVRIALAGATVLNLLLLFLVYIGWKSIWSTFPALNRWVFPDLNGEWKMTIHWQNAEASGVAFARAHIKQDLLRISMEVFSRDSDSETLIAQPKRDPESGRPILYYVYRVVPKNIKLGTGGSYEGSAILKLSDTGHDRLGGNYFTSRQTLGHFELVR
jgi:SMODS-associating 2TM, beta-strand rich effector domain